MQIDILIIGGGPAGLSAALHLQQIAPEFFNTPPRVLILEKEHYPRFKLCAGGLVGDAEVLLQGLGLDVREIPCVDARAAHFNFAGRGLTIRLPGTHTLRMIRRDEFDAWLAAKARERGIEIREGVSVKSIQPGANEVTVETNAGVFQAKVVLGADGSNGIVHRSIFAGQPLYTARLLEVLTPPNQRSEHALDEAYFDFSPIPTGIAGYTWDFPTQLQGQPMRCWGIYDSNIQIGEKRAALKASLAAEMARLGFNLAGCALKGHPIRWFNPFNALSAPRVLLVGDAAGADPLFGEGISLALGYGKLAAETLVDAFKREDMRLGSYRPRVLLSPLGQTLIARWLLAYLIYPLRWRWFQLLLWRGLKPLVLFVAWFFVLNWAKRMR